ncbi:hypothetical protein C8Q78DRAFT_1080560 [Trametes maxima]|nr:hypothetical protein C8Q78DRAFT_1080560 [Trametes maxima]
MANPDPKISQEELSSGGNTTSAPSSRQVPLRFGLTPIPELEESASDVRVDLHPGIAEATSPETNVTLSSAAADSALGEQTVSSPHTLVDSSPLANVSGEVALSDANIAQLPVTGDSPRREQVVSLPPEISAPSSPADIAGKPSLFDMNSASPPVAAGLVHREQTLSPSHDLDASPSPAGLAEAASLDANLALPVASSNPRETAPGADPSLPAPSGLAPPCHDLNQRSEEPSRRSTPSLKNSVLYAGFQEITAILRRLSTATKMPHEEVLACWTEYAEIPRTKSVNHWNVYCSYMKANPVQEIQRVDPSYNSSKPPGELLISMRQKCYDAFRSAYPDRWKTILDLFDSMQKQGKEVTSERERSRYFSRLLATLKNFATRYASLYGFEMLIVTGGNLESHDGPLLDMVTSPLAGEFIAKQLHISDDEMMKRFQNHIFAAYDGQFEEAASAPVIEGTNDSSALDSDHLLVESAPRASRRDRYDSEEVEVRNQQKTHFTRIQTIRNELRSRFIAAGGLFPTQGAWKKWPSLLARQGIVCRNWPAKVPWLGSDDVLHGNFSAGDQMAILSALKQQPNGLTFEKLDERHIPALCRGEQPVITRATPLNGAMYKIDGLYKACRTPMLEHTVQAETLPHVTKHGGDAITDPGAGHTDATVPEYTRSDSGAPTESYVPESGDPHGAQLPPLSTPLKRVASEEDLPGRKRQRTDSDDIDGVPMMETQNDSTTSVTGDHER